jgi:hypothetical protein
MPLWLGCCELSIPLVNRVAISHAVVTARADGNQIINICLTAPTLGDIVSALKVEHTDTVTTPYNPTFTIELVTHQANPNLLAKGNWNFLFSIR